MTFPLKICIKKIVFFKHRWCNFTYASNLKLTNLFQGNHITGCLKKYKSFQLVQIFFFQCLRDSFKGLPVVTIYGFSLLTLLLVVEPVNLVNFSPSRLDTKFFSFIQMPGTILFWSPWRKNLNWKFWKKQPSIRQKQIIFLTRTNRARQVSQPTSRGPQYWFIKIPANCIQVESVFITTVARYHFVSVHRKL